MSGRKTAHEVTLNRLERLKDHPHATWTERKAMETVAEFLVAVLDGRAAERTERDKAY